MTWDETNMGGKNIAFQPTDWGGVLEARGQASPQTREAMERLIQVYWKPVYFFIRRKGHGVETAKDLTQQFFLRFLEREVLKGVQPERGKFRTFLLTVLERFLCDEYDRQKAQKRTPDFDVREAETKFQKDNSFQHDWALSVLERSFIRLGMEAPREARIVEAQNQGGVSLKDLAQELRLTEANAKVLAHRGRKRLRGIILEELRATVAKPGEEQEELNELFQAFSL